ncbi:MAG: polysaccharide pyruvyl transferase family protein [Candidatus Bathyarchaeota archaeon]|nr:polysaccharide pyruvyl transferase family protein [Candidatus Bathyarchaeota archaeon]
MKILVYGGWFGSRNLGDEAILHGVAKLIKQRLPDAELIALSTDPEYTTSQSGVQAEKIESPRTLLHNRDRYLELFREADVHLLTGGTPFYDYGHLSRIVHMGLPALNRRKIVCFGVGSKPITTLMGREITRMLLRNASIISTRDKPSKQILQPLTGQLVKPITVTGDSALALNHVQSVTKNNLVLFCPRRLTQSHRLLYHQQIDQTIINRIRHMQARTADKLLEDDYHVAFLPFHTVPPDDDFEEIRVIRNLMRNEPETLPRPRDTEEALSIIGQSSLLVGLRLHSLIFASIQGTPHVSIDYDIKIRGFMEHMNTARYLSELNLGLDKLYTKTIDALENRDQYSRNIRKRVNAVRGLVNSEADRVSDYFTLRNTLSRIS